MAVLCPVMLKILTRVDSGLMEGGMAALTGFDVSWPFFTSNAKSTICNLRIEHSIIVKIRCS